MGAGPAQPAPRTGQALASALRLGLIVFCQYALLALDVRFIAAKNYAGIVVANVCIALNTWYMTRRIVEARSVLDRTCFIVGGTAGALVAVWLS